ncbi:neutral/alkaline ceramidase [Allokutzneria sp. NRRL B-24872]|uniref:neutral/alkaline ceramidase n=1 Tax=Allokutzneria sp. NRRL B-24872 TaxID=1137961 RepID=UPI000A38E816|nr:neutral/alkaline ceramidase [Allokutzneria sp. NRRL B-24872]
MRWLSGERVRGVLGVALAAVVGAATLVQLGEPAQATSADGAYLVGRGIADVTGEAAERGMMGYAKLDQRTSGIHQRQRSRAFVIADPASGKRVAMVTADLGMIFGSVRQAVLRKLAAKHGTLYSADNVLLTATHTHAGPGGQSHYSLYNITTFGYHGKTFDAAVDGIVESINRAHDDLAPGSLSLANGELKNASANRSRRAFDKNPAQDKAAFPDGIDPMTSLLRMDRGGRTVGAINWFATHNTSMTGNNTLISGDNKGYAAYNWEREVAGADYLAGQPGLVTAFAQTNAGDMSPNLNLKPGSGPTEDEFANTQILGKRQADAARALAASPGRSLSGGVDARLSHVDMSGTAVRPEFTGDGATHTTCQAAMGASFAAGSTEDGPGPDIFKEGVGNNPLIELVTKARYVASPALRACQAPKDILLDTGALNLTPKILPIQLVRVGQLYLIGLPQEATIVSGLRLRRTVAEQVGAPLQNVLVAGYANDYAGYLTTPEEYDQQDYEAGHTMFGRWSLPAYQQEFARIAADMKAGRPSAAGPTPPDMSGSVWTVQPGVVLDAPPIGGNFGDVVTAPKPSYVKGQQVVVEFAGAHPNNDVHRNGTFIEVQRQEGATWKRVADDGDWSTKFRWARWGVAASRVTVSWDVPSTAQPGSYRIVYRGDAKNLLGAVSPISGTSPAFTVT